MADDDFGEIQIEIVTFSLKKMRLKLCRLRNGGYFVSSTMC